MPDQTDIITALCEMGSKCSVCYRPMGIRPENCSGCNEYYSECNCTPLTPKQIIESDYIIE